MAYLSKTPGSVEWESLPEQDKQRILAQLRARPGVVSSQPSGFTNIQNPLQAQSATPQKAQQVTPTASVNPLRKTDYIPYTQNMQTPSPTIPPEGGKPTDVPPVATPPPVESNVRERPGLLPKGSTAGKNRQEVAGNQLLNPLNPDYQQSLKTGLSVGTTTGSPEIGAAVAALSTLANLGKTYRTGKGKDQQERDIIRKQLKARGLINDNYEFRFGDVDNPNVLNVGIDTDTKDNEEAAKLYAKTDLLAEAFAGGNQREWWSKFFANGAIKSGNPDLYIKQAFEKLKLGKNELYDLTRSLQDNNYIDKGRADVYRAEADKLFGNGVGNSSQGSNGGGRGGNSQQGANPLGFSGGQSDALAFLSKLAQASAGRVAEAKPLPTYGYNEYVDSMQNILNQNTRN